MEDLPFESKWTPTANVVPAAGVSMVTLAAFADSAKAIKRTAAMTGCFDIGENLSGNSEVTRFEEAAIQQGSSGKRIDLAARPAAQSTPDRLGDPLPDRSDVAVGEENVHALVSASGRP